MLEQLSLVTGRQVQVVHVVGGGTRNELLCQLTADLLCLPVHERFLAMTGLQSQRPAHAEV